MTAFYMFRLMYLTFHGRPRMSHEVEHHIHESPMSMTLPLVVLRRAARCSPDFWDGRTASAAPTVSRSFSNRYSPREARRLQKKGRPASLLPEKKKKSTPPARNGC